MPEIGQLDTRPIQKTYKSLDSEELDIMGFSLALSPYQLQIDSIASWAQERLSKVVCVVNTHILVEAYQKSDIQLALRSASMLMLNDRLIAWLFRRRSNYRELCIPDLQLFLGICEKAAQQEIPVFLLGSQSMVLEKITLKLRNRFPNIKIVGTTALPFGMLANDEDDSLVRQINDTRAGIVLVSLGCRHQERWMALHKDKVQSVMIGLGGVFPQYAGLGHKPPGWMRHLNLTFLFKLKQKLRRLQLQYFPYLPILLWAMVQKKLFVKNTHV